MKTSKSLWMNEPDLDQTSIRFSCPFCYMWVRKQEFERHIQNQHPQNTNAADAVEAFVNLHGRL